MEAVEIACRLHVAKAVAREAGAFALSLFRKRDELIVERKGLQDWVSRADREVEDLIRARLSACFPDDGFLGEETGLSAGADAERGIWVVDPIDGTASFLEGTSAWCVSIAYLRGREPLVGVIYDPMLDELFAASAGGGASLNGRPIRVSEATHLREGTTAVGFSFRCHPDTVTSLIAALLAEGGMFHRSGSGALMIAYVAAGRFLGYYEPHINAWDCLAAIVLVHEAGGVTNDFLEGEGLTRGNPILAAAPGVADALRAIVPA